MLFLLSADRRCESDESLSTEGGGQQAGNLQLQQPKTAFSSTQPASEKVSTTVSMSVAICVVVFCSHLKDFCLLFIWVTRPGTMQESVNSYFHCGPRDKPVGTLRVVAARELVFLSGSFTSQAKSVRQRCHSMVMQTMRDTQSLRLKGEKSPQPLLQWALNLDCWHDRRTYYHCHHSFLVICIVICLLIDQTICVVVCLVICIVIGQVMFLVIGLVIFLVIDLTIGVVICVVIFLVISLVICIVIFQG